MKSIEQDTRKTSAGSKLNGYGSLFAANHAGLPHISKFFSRLFKSIRNGIKKTGRFLKPFLVMLLHVLKMTNSRLMHLFNKVLFLGVSPGMDEYARRRLSLVNQINILHFISCIIIPLFTLVNNPDVSVASFILSLSPAFVSILVLSLNAFRKYQAALLVYFIFYPFFTCLIYLGGMNLGMELYFIVYGILAVFLLKDISYMVISVGFSMMSYFMLAVVLKRFSFELETVNPAFYLFNQILAIVFIFYGLFLIKKENTRYQESILQQNDELEKVNLEIEKRNEIIIEKARELGRQAAELKSLNTTKARLFSIISHDLKLPMYALRNVFQAIDSGQMSEKEIREVIPEVLNDINYTTGLMESLLQWAKNQMKGEVLNPQVLSLGDMVREITEQLRLQAEHKNIRVNVKVFDDVAALADKDTINIVIRNLYSNAIKFTPENGEINLVAGRENGHVKFSVADSGVGIEKDSIDRLFKGEYFSTRGTENEAGTGLGLMLCREFVSKNGGDMSVQSEPGKGSTFSFTLPVPPDRT